MQNKGELKKKVKKLWKPLSANGKIIFNYMRNVLK